MCKGHGHFVKKYLLKNFVNTFFKYSLLKVRPFGSYNFIALFTCLKKKNQVNTKHRTSNNTDNIITHIITNNTDNNTNNTDNNTDHLKRYP